MKSKQERLRDCEAELAKIRAELEHDERKEVVAVVGDVVYYGQTKLTILAPIDRHGDVVAIRGTGAIAELNKPCDLHTLDGRKIDRVVPFRIKPWKNRGYEVAGLLRYGPGLSYPLTLAMAGAERAAKTLWPWYDGPACVVEESE